MKVYHCDDGVDLSGETEEEVIEKYHEHLKEAHPEDFDRMMNMTPEEHDQMMSDVRAKIMDE